MVSLVVEQISPKDLAGVRFLHRPHMENTFYYGYVKDVWSNDINVVTNGLSDIETLSFLIQEPNKILFRIDKSKLDEAIKVLVNSVKVGAWHDIINDTEIVIIFSSKDVRKIPLDVSSDNETWLKMKELEPSIGGYKTLKQMINSSAYAHYLLKRIV